MNININDRIDLICLKRGIAGCAINVIKENKEVYKYNFGFSNINQGTRICDESIFHIASITKSITAMAIIKLISKLPKYSLNTTVYNIIRNHKNIYQEFQKYEILEYSKNITIFHLLSHKSGLRHYKTNKEFIEKRFSNLSAPKFIENLSIFGNDPLLFLPGKGYNYSSFGYILLTIIIEILSKKTYYEYIKKEILIPLGMENTIVDSDKRIVKQYYRIFKYIDNGYKKTCFSDFKKVPKINIFMKGGAGMLLSTVKDIAKFGNAIILGNYFDSSLKNKILRGNSLINDKNWYGLGWHQDKKLHPQKVWHSGGAIGGCGYLEIDIKKQTVFSILCNTQVKLDFANEIIKEINL